MRCKGVIVATKLGLCARLFATAAAQDGMQVWLRTSPGTSMEGEKSCQLANAKINTLVPYYLHVHVSHNFEMPTSLLVVLLLLWC